ncbi:MAG: hypothetical protein HS117_00990 [Verrucomicrobiaceae bacterium]|nr:hypothetical protein [Verrucomicrobiaceae bacterium]
MKVRFTLAPLLSLVLCVWAEAQTSIPIDQLGAEVQKLDGGGSSQILPTPDGAQLKAVLQDLEATATPEGLWLTSTANEDEGRANRFRVRAVALGRVRSAAGMAGRTPPQAKWVDKPEHSFLLAAEGIVHTGSQVVQWRRPGVVEQYGVSADGVRQDFIVTQRPPRNGEALRVDLEVSGAQAKQHSTGVILTIVATGRELAYARLKVVDATGRELPAEIHVSAPDHLQVLVQDDMAVYPVCIDPTFSDADWISMGGLPGINGTVYAMTTDSLGNVYAGGDFTVAGTTTANRIAKWNGSSWEALGTGANSVIYALACFGTDIYAGGEFTTMDAVAVEGLARWTGGSWSSVGAGLSSTLSTPKVYALSATGNQLYVGGLFSHAGGISSPNVAEWNGTSWAAVGNGTGGRVNAICVGGTNVYAGGTFTSAGGSSISRVAVWNGTAWSGLSSGVNGTVYALTWHSGSLFAGGAFTTAGGSSALRVASWNGSAWSAVGGGFNAEVRALIPWNGGILAGGLFSGGSLNGVSFWNGTAWSAVGGGTEAAGKVYGITTSGSEFFAGGAFAKASGRLAKNAARWNGTEWTSLGQGLAHEVAALAFSGNDLYLGGFFETVGGITARYIARWDGTNWATLGTGANDYITALEVVGTNLYAGGNFTSIGGVSAARIAKWDGTGWSALGSGMNASVLDLHAIGTDLYAVGNFTLAGAVSASRIAKWNGSTWQALGTGLTAGEVQTYGSALESHDGILYVGGEFTMAGGVTASRIARWDGNNWSALGSGMSGGINASPVLSLAWWQGSLYAGGNFSSAGGVPALDIARWDGTGWSSVGHFSGNGVSCLQATDEALFAGGSFTSVGGVAVSRIARWDGVAWSSLGAGTDGPVAALVAAGTSLYVGGVFNITGGKVSPYLSRLTHDKDNDGLHDYWENSRFGTTVGHSSLNDHDKDGYPELLELALGLNPTLPDPAGLPGVTQEGGYLTMTITKQPGVTYQVQTAGTLLSAQPDSFSATSTTVLLDNATTLKVRDNFLMSTTARRFIRAVVTAAP